MKEIIGAVAVFLTFAAYVPYYRDLLKGKTRPHVYSWSLWGLLSALLVALQIKGGAGPATWITAVAGLLCIGVVIFGLRNGKKNIAKSDTVIAGIALIAICFWLIADQPVISMILVLIADGLAFVPTIRKSWHDPFAETLELYVINAFRFSLAIAAVETYSFLSVSWPLLWAVNNVLFSVMLVIRRKQVKFNA